MITLLKTPLGWLALTLAAFSAYCEVSLFVSFAGDQLGNQLQAGVFAAALVCGQFLLISELVTHWQQGLRLLPVVTALVTATLLAISIGGTVFYFESQYQSALDHEQSGSDDYQSLSRLIDQKEDTIRRAKALADTESGRGNTWMAGQHTKAATRAERELTTLLDRRSRLQSATGTATVVGRSFDQYRWSVWLVFASVADLLPALAIVLLKTPNRKTRAVKTAHNTIEQQAQQPLFASLEDPQQPENSTEIQPFATVRHAIEVLGYMPSWSLLKQQGFTYTSYKKQRDELVTAGLVRQNGQSYQLVQEQTA